VKSKNPAKSPTALAARRAEFAADAAAIDAQTAIDAAKFVKEQADKLPKPDLREDVNFQRLAGLEQSMLARISPWGRNRWPELVRLEERIAEFDQRQEDVRTKLRELHERRGRAETDHAAAFAEWLHTDQVGAKPVSEAAELEAGIIEGNAELAALDNLRDRVLEEKIDFVRKHRKRLVQDAEQATGEARERYLRLVDELAQVREELIGLRTTTVWAQVFPSETLASQPPHAALMGGRLNEQEQHLPGLKRELPVYALLALLRADADYFSTVSTIEQAAIMQNTTPKALKGGAMWAGSEEDVAWQKRDKERLIEMYERTWNMKPAEYA